MGGSLVMRSSIADNRRVFFRSFDGSAQVHYRLRVVIDEPTARVELLHKNIRKFGTITNTLASACELTGEIEAIAPVSPQGTLLS